MDYTTMVTDEMLICPTMWQLQLMMMMMMMMMMMTEIDHLDLMFLHELL